MKHIYLYFHKYKQRNTDPHIDVQIELLTLSPHPRSLPPSQRHPHLAFHPKETVHIQTNRRGAIVQMQLSCTVHLLDCYGTKGPLLMRLAVCE